MEMIRMCDTIEAEINKIAEKGLTSNNLDIAYKLIDMYKDLKTVEAMEDAGYKDTIAYENYPVSMREKQMRNKYSMESADPKERYMSAKESYRYSKAIGDRQSMLHSLDEYMDEMTEKLQNMMHDADTQEERDMIQKYINKVRM